MSQVERMSIEEYFYYFIIYELIKGSTKGYAICSTTQSKVHEVANRKANDVERCALFIYPNYLMTGRLSEDFYGNNGVLCDNSMIELLIRRIEINKSEGWTNPKRKYVNRLCLAEKDLKYFILPTYFKKDDLTFSNNFLENTLTNARNGQYDDIEHHEYLIPENKWKSEQLVYELTKKLFKGKSVIYQHSPHFLRGLTYDVFVVSKKIAIEYQGKQHFEPVDFFGGKESFEAQQKRDMLKIKLSEENGIKLVFINYWEDISLDLIKEKISAFI